MQLLVMDEVITFLVVGGEGETSSPWLRNSCTSTQNALRQTSHSHLLHFEGFFKTRKQDKEEFLDTTKY